MFKSNGNDSNMNRQKLYEEISNRMKHASLLRYSFHNEAKIDTLTTVTETGTEIRGTVGRTLDMFHERNQHEIL